MNRCWSAMTMMKKKLISGWVLATAVTTVQAMPACDYLLERAGIRTQDGVQMQIRDEEGACFVRHGQWDAVSSSMIVAFDELRFSGVGLEQEHQESLPQAVRLDVSGIYILTGRLPGQDYLMRLQARPMRFGLAYEWRAQSGQLRVERAVLQGESLREIGLQATAQIAQRIGQPLRVDDLQSAKLQALSFRLDNASLVQSMIMPVLVSNIGLYEDPKPAIEAGLLAARTAVMVMPAATASAASRKALLEFIGDLPAPDGRLDLALTFDPPLDSAGLAAAGSLDEARKALASMKVQARYDKGSLPLAYVRVRDWLRSVLSVSGRRSAAKEAFDVPDLPMDNTN